MSQETKPHAHKPKEPIAAFYHTCKVCGVPIEAETCLECDGYGRIGTWIECPERNGSGVERWVKAE